MVHSFLRICLFSLLPACLAAALSLWQPPSVQSLRHLVFDQYQVLKPRSSQSPHPITLIEIDDTSLEALGQWPWPRQVLGDLVNALHQGQPKAIGLDLLLSEEERIPSQPQTLETALHQSPAVLGLALNDQGIAPSPKATFAQTGDDPRHFVPRFQGAILPLAPLTEAAKGLGALNWLPDRDMIVRRVPTILNVQNTLVPGFALEVLRVALGERTIVIKASNASGESGFGQSTGITAVKVGPYAIPVEGDGALRVHYAGSSQYTRIPAWQVLRGQVPAQMFHNAIVLIGISASALADVRATPLASAVPGVEVHAEALAQMMSGQSLQRPDFMPGLEALAAFGLCLIMTIAALSLRPASSTLIALLLLGGVAITSWLAFTRQGWLIDPVLPSGALLLSFASATLSAYRHTDQERRMVREAFARYVSPAVLDQLARQPSSLKLGGETRDITVLFADLRGFTARSENLSAAETIAFLNEMHTPLTEEIMARQGTVDKFLGDGLMAFWNAPLHDADHLGHALEAALAMQQRLHHLNEDLSLSIGLHTGPASIGNIGSAKRFDYSAVGDTVNTAARIEPLCKIYHVPVLVSGRIVGSAPLFRFLLVDEVTLRGHSRPTRLYALHGPPMKDFDSFKARHDAAIDAFLQRRPEALTLLHECEDDQRSDSYRMLYNYHREKLIHAA